MFEQRIENSKIELFTNQKEEAQKIQEIFSAFEPGYEHNMRYRMGKWNGKQNFFVVNVVKRQGWLFKFELGFKTRIEQLTGEKFPSVETNLPNPIEFIKNAIKELPFKPYQHQIKLLHGIISTTRHSGISCTGSGKSLVIYLALKYYLQNNLKTLVLVPTVDLTEQLKGDCIDYNADTNFMESIQLIGGENNQKDLNKDIVVSTWQSAMKLNWSEYDVVLCDEMHKAKADQLQNILSSPFKIKAGITGSYPIEELSAMKLESKFGHPHRYINASQLAYLGLASHVTIVAMFLSQKASIMKYQDEVKFIKDNLQRRIWVARFALRLKGLSFLLYQHTEHGLNTFKSLTGCELTPKLRNNFEEMKKLKCFFISGTTKSSVRKQIREYLEHAKDDIRVIGQISVLATGINIKRLKHLVYLSSSKSYTQTLQSIGRVLRLHEDKGNNVYVYDLIDDFTNHGKRKTENYSLRHFFQRNVYYESEGFKVIEKEIQL